MIKTKKISFPIIPKIVLRLIALIVLMFAIQVNAQQTSFSISGYLKDSLTNKPIQQAHIILEELDLGTKSDDEGFYKVMLRDLPATIRFTHVSYRDKIIHITEKESRSLDMKMEIKEHILPLVNIIDVYKPQSITKDKPVYVYDYEFFEDKILLLAYQYGKITKPRLVLMDMEGDSVICTKSVHKPEQLFKDCMDINHFITKNQVYQIQVENNAIHLIYPVPVNEFYAAYSQCLEEVDGKFYMQRYMYNNQVLQYYLYDRLDSTSKELCIIADEFGMTMLRNKGRFFSMGETPTAADLRFEEMCFFDPIFAPLVKINDSICILNYVENKIQIYSPEGDSLKREIPITYHQDDTWEEEVYIDEGLGKVYALFRKNGIATLKEIDLSTGELGKAIKISEFNFVEKIQILNNQIYFMYQKEDAFGFKQLYKMEIME